MPCNRAGRWGPPPTPRPTTTQLANKRSGLSISIPHFSQGWAFFKRRVALKDVVRCDLPTKQPIPFQAPIVTNGIAEQEFEVVDALQPPSSSQEESLQALLDRLLQTEGGVIHILLRQSPCDPLEILRGNAKPVLRVPRLTACHTLICLSSRCLARIGRHGPAACSAPLE